ncbi:MAG: hypothetical protein R2712_09395 [Vicinamibacterales bacterium]
MPHATFITLDLTAPTADACHARVSTEARHRPQLIARPIETHDQFAAAADAGFTLFRGFFLGRSVVASHEPIPGHTVDGSGCCRRCATRCCRWRASRLIRPDATLCYHILRTVNSAAFAQRRQISPSSRRCC